MLRLQNDQQFHHKCKHMTLNEDSSQYGQMICPELMMHLRAFFAHLRHAHCKTTCLEKETRRI